MEDFPTSMSGHFPVLRLKASPSRATAGTPHNGSLDDLEHSFIVLGTFLLSLQPVSLWILGLMIQHLHHSAQLNILLNPHSDPCRLIHDIRVIYAVADNTSVGKCTTGPHQLSALSSLRAMSRCRRSWGPSTGSPGRQYWYLQNERVHVVRFTVVYLTLNPKSRKYFSHDAMLWVRELYPKRSVYKPICMYL